MKVNELMTKNVRTCRPDDILSSVARDMWDGDCGCVPVIDEVGHPIAMVTDRDICMASFLTGEPLHRIPVKSAASQSAHTVREEDTIDAALALMREQRVRRLPVVDVAGRLVGVLSSADIVRHEAGKSPAASKKTNGISPSAVTWTLASISEPWKPSLVRLPPVDRV
jgi:CBS domain-containing protein